MYQLPFLCLSLHSVLYVAFTCQIQEHKVQISCAWEDLPTGVLTRQALTTHECAWSEVMATRRPKCLAVSSAAFPAAPAPGPDGEPLGEPSEAQEWEVEWDPLGEPLGFGESEESGEWDWDWSKERALSLAASRHTSTASLAVPCITPPPLPPAHRQQEAPLPGGVPSQPNKGYTRLIRKK